MLQLQKRMLILKTVFCLLRATIHRTSSVNEKEDFYFDS